MCYIEKKAQQLDNRKVFELVASSLKVVWKVQEITITRHKKDHTKYKCNISDLHIHTIKRKDIDGQTRQEKTVTSVHDLMIKIKLFQYVTCSASKQFFNFFRKVTTWEVFDMGRELLPQFSCHSRCCLFSCCVLKCGFQNLLFEVYFVLYVWTTLAQRKCWLNIFANLLECH